MYACVSTKFSVHIYICSADLLFILIYTCVHAYCSAFFLAASTTFCPFFLFTFFSFSCRCVFRSIFSAMYAYVDLMVQQLYRRRHDEKEWGREREMEKEASSSSNNSRATRRRINVQCKGQTNGCIHTYKERKKKHLFWIFFFFSFFQWTMTSRL